MRMRDRIREKGIKIRGRNMETVTVPILDPDTGIIPDRNKMLFWIGIHTGCGSEYVNEKNVIRERDT